MHAEVLPLAITMMAGPQILSAIIFVTGDDPVKKSLAFVLAVPLAMSATILVFLGLAGLFDDSLRADAEPSTGAKVAQLVLVALLVAAAIRSYLGRETSEPPKWLGGLQQMSAGRAFLLGLLLLSVFPSDFMILATTAINLVSNDLPFSDALPLIGVTTLIAALPLLGYLAFRRRAEVAMPRARDWMNANSWLINIIVYAIFIALILG
jgi:hypothetical protein